MTFRSSRVSVHRNFESRAEDSPVTLIRLTVAPCVLLLRWLRHLRKTRAGSFQIRWYISVFFSFSAFVVILVGFSECLALRANILYLSYAHRVNRFCNMIRFNLRMPSEFNRKEIESCFQAYFSLLRFLYETKASQR